MKPRHAVALACLSLALTAAAPPPATVRRMPRVLTPAESASAVARVGARCYIIEPGRGKGKDLLFVLKGGGAGKDAEAFPVPIAQLRALPGNVRPAEQN